MEQIHYPSSTDVIEAKSPPDDTTKNVARFVVSQGLTSTSDLQQYLGFGYARANRIMDTIERLGIGGGLPQLREEHFWYTTSMNRKKFLTIGTSDNKQHVRIRKHKYLKNMYKYVTK